jgi:CRP/FNR family transcriptional regulator, cyclic AMP receptor protein
MKLNLFLKKPISSRLTRLRALSLFETLTPGELRNIDSLLHEREYLKEEILFDQGEEAQAVYVVLEGAVSIARRIDGVEQFLTEYRPGEFFGELALVDRGPRAAQARAAANCRVAVLFREDFMALLNTHPVAASKITLQMARHLAYILRQSASAQQAEQKVFL